MALFNRKRDDLEIALDPQSTSAEIGQAAWNTDYAVQYAIAKNPNTSNGILLSIVISDEFPEIQAAALSHPSLELARIERFINENTITYAMESFVAVAGRSDLTDDLIAAIAEKRETGAREEGKLTANEVEVFTALLDNPVFPEDWADTLEGLIANS